MKRYCQKCNQPTEYTGAKPKFCSSCGSAYDGSSMKTKKATPEMDKEMEDDMMEQDDQMDQEDETSCKKKFNIKASKLDVEIIPYKVRGSSLKDVLLSGLEGPREFERPTNTDIDKTREDWKREASAGRKQQISDEVQEENEDLS